MADKDDARLEFNPKHRIVGAIVIVALAVIFLPLILEERAPPPDIRGSGEIPAPDEASKTKVVVSVVGADAKNKTSSETAAKPDTKPAATEKPATPVKPPAAPIVPAKKPEAAPAKEKAKEKPAKAPANKPANGWIVQVGTFSNFDNAGRLREKLKSHGHPVQAENVSRDGTKAMRLYVGPFRAKPEALKAKAQIEKESGLQGVVRAYP